MITFDGNGQALTNLLVYIDPVQAGSGAPSPSNIRTISGWTGATISHSGADTSNPTVKNISWQTEVGTIYGGTLDVISGVLTVDQAKITFNGSESWGEYTSYEGFRILISDMKSGARLDGISNMLIDSKTSVTGQTNAMWLGINNQYLYVIGVYESMGSTLAEFKEYLSDHNLEIVYPFATSLTYQLTAQQITTIIGENKIWADCGDIISLSYNSSFDCLRSRRALMAVQKGGRLPAAYQEVAWIGSNGNQYINTGIVPSDTSGMKLEAAINVTLLSTQDWAIVGLRQNNNRWFTAQSYRSWYWGWNNYHYTNNGTTTANVFDVLQLNYKNDRKFIVEGKNIQNITETLYASFSAPAFIFAANDGTTAVLKAKCNIKFVEFTSGSNVIASFVPCYRKADGVIGMYDTVRKAFYTNSGTGTFTKGADVT